MARKSNKTSHVLHLLAGEEPVPEPSEKEDTDAADKETDKGGPSKDGTDKETPAPGPSGTAAAQDGPDIPIISAGSSGDDPVADLIREQLEEEFPEDILAPQTAAQDDDRLPDIPSLSDTPADTESADSDVPQTDEETTQSQTDAAEDTVLSDGSDPAGPQSAPAPKEETPDDTPKDAPKDIQDDIPQDAPTDAPEDRGSDQDVQIQTAPADEIQERPDLDQQDLDPLLHPQDEEGPLQNYRFVNVMEYIVKDLVIDYMKKFGMCTCERCVVDTMALALTYCPAKYIVVDSHSVSPLLNYYSNKYLGDVTVELTKACIKIKDNPRH